MEQRHHTQEPDYRIFHSNTSPTKTKAMRNSSGLAQQRASTSSTTVTAIQLTPLWEHILRTRKIPETITPRIMFAEFLERLKDPEWQVRQHALRVFVDVLVVMKSKADPFMEPLIGQLVENLGHQAPTVRKGALDCLRVYLAETGMPDTVMFQILDIGLNQKITNEPFGGRLTCGVMLSLPALVQSTLHTSKRHYILRTTIDMLVQKMGQVTHQEITLKVLRKTRELIGEAEFVKYMSHGAYREFDLLCNVYGLSEQDEGLIQPTSVSFLSSECQTNTWRLMAANKPSKLSNCWRSAEDDDVRYQNECTNNVPVLACPAKVIMETEIKINDDTLTMRILEAKDDDVCLVEQEACHKSLTETCPNSLEDEVVCGRLASAKNLRESSSNLVKLLSDSDDMEEEKPRQEYYTTIVTPSTPSRTPKRVTFGGEVVKMRTPDSDANSATNSNHNHQQQQELQHQFHNSPTQENNEPPEDISNQPPFVIQSPPLNIVTSKTSVLTLEIPNDNTKPLITTKSENIHNTPSPKISSSAVSTENMSPKSPKSASKSPKDSPKSPLRRLSISPVDVIVSPRTTAHKQIEVLHNLQRDPSPNRALTARRASLKTDETVTPSAVTNQSSWMDTEEKRHSSQQSPAEAPPPPPPRSWEELGIVDDDSLLDLRSGNWHHRLQGVLQLEQALRSSENLALVQPCLESLLRTLLSSECKAEVAEEKRKLIINLITRLPLDNLEDRTMQIMSGLCRQGGAGANRVCKALMQRLPPATIILKLISQEFLHAKSSRFREHALQMVIYAFMTFPSTCFDNQTCVTNATYAALNRKRRVRQAALDVLSVLGQISTTKEVLPVVQEIAKSRDDGAALLAAVKTRLARKQLPLVTSEGAVQYSLHVTPTQSTMHMHDNELKSNESSSNNNSTANEDFSKTPPGNGQQGPDIDWITAGIGSVSPTSLKRRAHRNRMCAQQSFTCIKTQGSSNSDDPVYKPLFRAPDDLSHHTKTYESDDNHQNYNFHHVFASNPYNYGLTSKKSNAEHLCYTTRRLVANSCSDSSVDGRSSDSNYTSSGGSIVSNDVPGKGGGDGISGRFTRQAVNSRFPTMEMNSMNSTYRVHKPPTYYPGMGAYAHLQQQQYNMNSTYPKVNYSLASQHQPQLATRRKSQHQYSTQNHHQQQQQSPPYYYINNNTNRAQHFNHHNAITTLKNNCGNQENFKMSENLQYKDSNNCGDKLDGTYTISAIGSKHQTQQHTTEMAATTVNGRRFVNVNKFLSNKSSQTANGNINESDRPESERPESETAKHDIDRQSNKTPTSSLKSSTYSQKSTASAQSSNGSRSLKEETMEKSTDTISPKEKTNDIEITPLIINESTLSEAAEMTELIGKSPSKWKTGGEVLQVEDVVDADVEYNVEEDVVDKDIPFERNGSLASIQSKTESIKTQLEDTPPVLSRAQSSKSLAIEEDIEDNSSFVVVEDIEVSENLEESEKTVEEDMLEPVNGKDETISCSKPCSAKSRPGTGRSRSPTIEEIKALSRRNSLIKSMESLYERLPAKNDYLDNTTETSSQSSAQLNSSTGSNQAPLKAYHTPLKQKSKTTHFLKSHRRISPVKQSIKMVQAELYPASLEKFEKPREGISKTFDQLDSSNWEVIMVGLKNMVRLMRYHSENLDNQMHMICIQLTKSVRNLRSQVARAACTAATELFTLKSRVLEQECDDLVCALLHRTADTNRFIRADATRALESMCDNLMPQKILNILTTKGAAHPHALVRTSTAKLLNRLVERLSCAKIYTLPRDQRDKFFITGANLLLEGSLETRCYAKSLFKLLSGHPSYHRLLLDVIPQRTYRNIEKTLKSIL